MARYRSILRTTCQAVDYFPYILRLIAWTFDIPMQWIELAVSSISILFRVGELVRSLFLYFMGKSVIR